MCQMSSRSVYSVVLWRRKKNQFLPFFAVFWISAFSDVANCVINLRKLSMGAQLQTFPYPTASKSFLYYNAFMAKSGAQTLTFKSVTNKQTNRQKTQRSWPPRRRVKSQPTKLGMVIEDLEHVFSSPKTFRGLTHSFAARGRWKFGGKQTPSTWNPITP